MTKRILCSAFAAMLSFAAFAAVVIAPILRVAGDAFVTAFADAPQRFALFVRASAPAAFALARSRARSFRAELLARRPALAFGDGLSAV
jgi:hypothetical protein